MLRPALIASACLPLLLPIARAQQPGPVLPPGQEKFGIFDTHQDVGRVQHPGSAKFDRASGTYTITGNGENMWVGRDDFHFAWTRVSGDVALTAEIAFTSSTGNPHRKAVLDIRQSLDGSSKAVDIAEHGDGLTSLQFRAADSADTHEVESTVSAPQRVRIVKRGDFVYAFVQGADGRMHPAGAATKITFSGPFYIGIGVCSHDKDASASATFRNVTLTPLAPSTQPPVLYSVLETTTANSTDRHVEYLAPAHFEAPNWSHDGSFFLFNEDGRIYKLPLHGATPSQIPTAPDEHANNDHGLSPDNEQIAISDQTIPGGSSIYLLPVGGGTPRRITRLQPSYWHGWSPDGNTLAFTGQRNGEFDIYTIPAAGGEETRLTTAKGLDDGPEYSPDGKWIYFNSERTGLMQIWRMHPDGSAQEHVIAENSADWFPHISPDGTTMVYLAYDKSVSGHPGQKDVQLKLRNMADGKTSVLANLFGGQGTINVPSWSPDSKKVAFVSYELLAPEDLNAQ